MYRLLLTALLIGCGTPTDTGKDTAPADEDGDGYTGADDCNPLDGTIHPGAAETCDDIDNNCDGNVDEGVAGTFYKDADGDGYGDKNNNTTACTVPDGYITDGSDCNDVSGAVNPGALEVCNFTDDNCDGNIDEGALSTFYADADGDGYGNTDYTYDACVAPDGYTSAGGDCDDGDETTYPGAEEEDCTDPVDHNCDGSVGYDDADGDGFAACDDCDDHAPGVNPSAKEVCDAGDVDEDCDGLSDDADPSATGQTKTWGDFDGDGYGDAGSVSFSCDPAVGSVTNDADCDDVVFSTNPGATETCNDVDDDCDGTVDDGVRVTVYLDKDGDGYGSEAYTMEACEVGTGWSLTPGDCDDNDTAYNPGATEDDCNDPNDYNCDGTTGFYDADGDGWAACADCDDADPAISPDAVEVCGGGDEDCNGLMNDDDPGVSDQIVIGPDMDGDGFGDPVGAIEACEVGDGWVLDLSDCDDTSASVNPAAYEACDDIDNDCDGTADDAATDAVTWYLDYDGDGHGSTTKTYVGCAPPSGYVATSDDCADGDADNFPGNTEVCDEADNNCDGVVDDGVAPSWYEDTDGDGYGTEATVTHVCTRPYGYVSLAGDCDDTHADANPVAGEVCDGYDNDCDGLSDDADSSLDASTGEVFFPDTDGDSYGDAAGETWFCVLPGGWTEDDTDCDDTTSAVHPGLWDDCNDVNNDCDADTDEDGWETVYVDADGDGAGDLRGDPEMGCVGDGYSNINSDCDDSDPTQIDCSFYAFDGTTGTSWETMTTTGGATSNYSSSVYVPLDDTRGYYSTYSSKVYAWDLGTSAWTSFSGTNPLSSQPYISIAPYDGKYWNIHSGSIRSFDPTTSTWTTVGTISMSDYYPMTESDEYGVIYGYDYSAGKILMYDTLTGATSTVSTGKTSLYEPRLGYDPETRALFFGAYSSASLYKYDLTTGAVSTMTSIPESQLNDIFCSDRAGHIYAAGGSSGKTIYQYDIATNAWAKIPDLPADHSNVGSCSVSEAGYLYVTTGSRTVYRLALY